MSAPIPFNEEQRLQSVRETRLLDTAPEAAYDAIARLAARTFRVPMASVGLLDADRLWFKARTGFVCDELAREHCFCAHAILQPDAPLIIEDLERDGRFADNPQVLHTPGLRFYAGAPLVTEQGLPLGTLAVMDTQPRAFGAADQAALKDLAELVMEQIRTRQTVAHLRHLAMTDPLTGLSNRTQFHHAITVELAHAMRTGEAFTVLSMDLDGYTDVHDGFGHAAAEEVLVEVARRLAQQVRLGDELARFGGDEFGVVMRHGAKDSAQILAKRIVRAVSAPIRLSSGDEIGVGISIGMAAYNDRVESVAMLLAQADQALYQAKKQNEKRWKMFVGIR
jgi:diguanylate cyclase (GGDEF)-like protein